LTIRALFPRRAVLPAAALAAALLVQACQAPRTATSNTRLYASDLAGGAAVCTVPDVKLTNGKESATTMTVGNDGGWCGVTAGQLGHPYATALLTERPAHGKVYVHPVGDATRIDYTPDRGFAGSDSFAVRLIPGDAVLRVAVTVKPKA